MYYHTETSTDPMIGCDTDTMEENPRSVSSPSRSDDDCSAAASAATVEQLAAVRLDDDHERPATPSAGGEKPPPPAAAEHEHPRRPGQPDCGYYVRFGSCMFGMDCVLNHPAAPMEEYDCLHYVRFGNCKYGMSCRLNHPPRKQRSYFPGKSCNSSCNHRGGKSEVEKVNLNLLGLPLRPGTGVCSYYMNRGTCKFGTHCEFHHPDPKSVHDKCDASRNSDQISSQLNIYSVHDHGESKWRPVPPKEVCEPTERICYTIDQLLELREALKTDDVSKDSLELQKHMRVQMYQHGEDECCRPRSDTNVQTRSYKRFDKTGSRDWRSRSAQTPAVCSCCKQEQINKHDQVGPTSSLAKTGDHCSLWRGNLSGKDDEKNERPSNSAPSISEIMELVVAAGAEEGSDEHFIATVLFIKPEYREIFLTLNSPNGRLGLKGCAK